MCGSWRTPQSSGIAALTAVAYARPASVARPASATLPANAARYGYTESIAVRPSRTRAMGRANAHEVASLVRCTAAAAPRMNSSSRKGSSRFQARICVVTRSANR